MILDKRLYLFLIFISILISICVLNTDAKAQQASGAPQAGQTAVVQGGATSQPSPSLGQQGLPGQTTSLSEQDTKPLKEIIIQRPTERLSSFEQYISEKTITVNEKQFDIIKKFRGITFSYSPKTDIMGQVTIPIKVVGPDTTGIPIEIDAGYLIGTQEALNAVFKVLGISGGLGISLDIKQFGYDLFRASPTTFAPVDTVPVGPDYILGPGDEIKIAIWGNVSGQYRILVDRNGNISLPKIQEGEAIYKERALTPEAYNVLSVLNVTGITFSQLKELIYKEYSKYYTGFDINITMGSLRSIMVYVVGYAERPGAYTISSLSTLLNALFVAGGPNKNGTMRDIQVNRNGKTIVHFDIYDLLLKGDKTNDIRLMPEDVIFIPPVGDLVAIAGNVKNPAIYELKGEAGIMDLITMAGGLSAMALKGRVQIQRVEGNQYRIIFEGDLRELESRNVAIKNGDIVKIFQVPEIKNTITVEGAITTPGEYAIVPGKTTIKDIITLANGLLYFASKDAEITRIKISQEGPTIERFTIDISEAIKGDPNNNISLEINDHIFIKAIPEWQLYQKVTIYGEVRYPGAYTIKKGEKLSSLIERAGGYTERAYLRGAEFTRERVRESQQKNMNELIQRLERELLSASSAQVAGALSTEELSAQKAELEQKQKFIDSLRKLRATGRLTIRLAHLRLLKGSDFDIELEDGDSLYIPRSTNIVNVMGSVMTQGTFVYSPSLNYKDYINLAGGVSRYADADNMYVMKVDGSAMKISRGWLSWNNNRSRWEIAQFGESIKEIEPGDTIVVPEKMERISWLREIKDITQILANIAITAGVVKALYDD